MNPTLLSARLQGLFTPQRSTNQTPARSGRGTGWLRTARLLTGWLALLLIGTSLSNAQDGSIDPTFNPTGTGPNGGSVGSVVVQADGKILIGGQFTAYNGTARNNIARLNGDGPLDTGFTPGQGANNSVGSVAVQGDGKILIGGQFTAYNGVPRNFIARLNANGTLDPTFNPGGGGPMVLLVV